MVEPFELNDAELPDAILEKRALEMSRVASLPRATVDRYDAFH